MSSIELSTVSKALQALDTAREEQSKVIRKLVIELHEVQQRLSAAVDLRDAIDQQARDILQTANEDNVYRDPKGV